MPKGVRCNVCREKLNVLAQTIGKCSCGEVFCEQHRHPEDHECNVDWRARAKTKLARDNPRVQVNEL